MRTKKILALMLVILSLSTLTACKRETIQVVPRDNQGRIETVEGIFIDTEDMTLTFGQDSFVICGDERLDMSGTSHDISKYTDGDDLFLHPSSKTLSPIGAYENILLGKLNTPLFASELNITSGPLYVDGVPASRIEALIDKTVVCLGDSMTEGVGTTKVYYEWFPQLCGFSTVNAHGVAGSSISPKIDKLPIWETGIESFCDRYQAMEDEADVVVVLGGVNDWVVGRDLGTPSDTDTTTFYGSMDVLCQGLKAKYPEAKIIFFSSPQNNYVDRPANELPGTQWEGNTEGYNRKGYRLTDYANAMETVCARYDIPFCSLTEAFQWGAAELGNYSDTDGLYGSDAIHPNAEGHALMARKMAKFINSCFGE